MRSFGIKAVLAVLLAAWAGIPAAAQVDEEVAEKMMDRFKRDIDSSDVDEQVSAIRGLKDADCPKGAELLLDLFNEDDIVLQVTAVEVMKTFRNPDSIATIVKKGLLGRKSMPRKWSAVGLGYMSSPGSEAEEALTEVLEKERNPEVKAAVIRALGRLKVEAAGPDLIKEVEDKSPLVRMEAAYALSRIKPDGALKAIAGLLTDPVWQVRVQAVERLVRYDDPRIVPFLIKRLPKENGRLREDILARLSDLTAQDFGLDYKGWENWWSENEARFMKEFGSRKQTAYQKPKYAEGYSYYNITTYSKSFIFILDVSGSMTETILPAKSYGYGLTQIPRIDLAKQELIKLLESMTEDTMFNIVHFAGGVTGWKDSLQTANVKNKAEAIKWVNNIQCIERGQIMTVTTNLYAALDSVLKMAEPGLTKRNYASSADTIFLLSDGVPTGPDWLTDRDAIVEVVEERNRHLKMRIHTISLAGDMETPRFLSALSEPNGGEMKNVLRE